jgi:hypothetical protein
MSTWRAAVDATLNIVRAIPGISTATWPQDSQNAPLFAVGYVGSCDDFGGPPGSRKSLGEIHVEVCTSHTEALKGVAALMPLADSIPAELLKVANYQLTGTVETFQGVRRSGIEQMPVSGYMGIRFTLYGVKIITTL